MNRREAIEHVVMQAREDEQYKLKEIRFERLCDAIQAECGLPNRRPEWVAWAQATIRKLRKMDADLEVILRGPADP